MKVSLNHIRFYQNMYKWSGDPALDGVEKLAEKIGAQLGAIEEVIDLGKKYHGIVVVKVVSCVDHPNADRLHVCKVDDGGKVQNVERDENGFVQVVCGAPNVHEGMLAAWLPPGSTVPSTVDKDPFVLEARDIRGQVSNGMMASPKELDIGDSHEGILEIDEAVEPGASFAEAYGLNDYIFDIENKMFTHRPDCFGMMGVAREIAGIQQQQFTSPEWYRPDVELPKAEQEALHVELKNELPDLAPRFLLLPMSNVKVGPSPFWLQVNLARLGVRPINNVVDLSNYYMLLTGQPTHAYDYDKVVAQDANADHATIVVRHLRPSEKISLLNGKEVEPRKEAIMIASRDKLIGIGGVMGGGDTEVDGNTKNVIVEVATFDMYSIRRTSMAHGLFTDAVTRFNKGQSPLQNRAVMARLAADLTRLAGAQVAGAAIDDNHLSAEILERGSVHPPVSVTPEFINARLGLELSAGEISQLLKNVEFDVQRNGDDLTIKAPFWRTDIEIPEDVVEEVGRLYGYDHLPLELPKRDLAPAPEDKMLELKSQIRSSLSKAGANEVLTYSFVHGNLLDKVGQDKSQAFQIANALSPDLQYYRLSLVPSLLDKVHANIKAGYDEFALFELGKTHGKDQGEDDDGLPREFEFTSLVIAAADKLKKSDAAYYQARKYLEFLVGRKALEFKPVGAEMEQYQVVRPYDLNRTAMVSLKGGEFLGIIGEFKPSVTRALKLPKYCAGFEVDTAVLAPTLAAGPSYLPLPRFPKVVQDITLKVAADLSFAELYEFVDKETGANAIDETLIQLDPLDIFQRPDDREHKQVTFRFTTTSYARTLTDAEVAKILDNVAAAAKDKFNAELV